MKEKVISSPIRWAGSKKRILNEMLESFDKESKIYIEPFLGSGVVLLNVLNNINVLGYEKIYVNDINSNIIDFYTDVQENPDRIVKSLLKISEEYNSKKSIEEKSEMYYDIRKKFNKKKTDKSTYFYFLMKVGFNGVYRENKKGNFNVPFGKKEKFIILEEEFKKISIMIQNVTFYNLSYEMFIKEMIDKKIIFNSFMYCDPPYLPDDKLVSQKQELYTSGNFNHIEFVNILNNINKCKILISMSKSTIASKIYGKKFKEKKLVDIIRTINPKKLFKSSEILFFNYKMK